jgi:hypothetical protein
VRIISNLTNHNVGKHELRQAPPGYIAKKTRQQLAQPLYNQRAPLPSQYAPMPVFGSGNSRLAPDNCLPPPPAQGNAMSRCEDTKGWRTLTVDIRLLGLQMWSAQECEVKQAMSTTDSCSAAQAAARRFASNPMCSFPIRAAAFPRQLTRLCAVTEY